MECMEARALKSSFVFSELAMKTSNQLQGGEIRDDFWCVTGLPGGEEFSVDEFFDLPPSNEEATTVINNQNQNQNQNASFSLSGEDEEEEEKDSSSSLSSHDLFDDPNFNSLDFSPHLAIPVDDLQELELWSHFMDDSVPEATLACPNPIMSDKTGFHTTIRFEPGRKPVQARVPFIPSAVPVKPRTKRSRTGSNRSWLTGSTSSDSSSSSSSSPTRSMSSPVSTLLFPPPVFFTFGKPPVKKPKKKPAAVAGEEGATPVLRRCTHCLVTKTPQWRAGPNGPKTLCNACGVRFKSGRLFPEYRPACSPTFSSEIHSNSHRKVLEMRKRKETGEPVV